MSHFDEKVLKGSIWTEIYIVENSESHLEQ